MKLVTAVIQPFKLDDGGSLCATCSRHRARTGETGSQPL